MRLPTLKILSWCLCVFVPGTAALGQDANPAQSGEATLEVFLDCQTFFCDFDHFRREI